MSAAPPPDDPGLASLRDGDVRVATIGYRLATANADLCRDRTALAGLVLHDLLQYRAALRPEAARLFALAERPGVMGVVPGGPADRAGLRAGDTLLAIGGEDVPADPPSLGATDRRKPSYAGTARAAAMLERAMAKGGSATIAVRRGGATLPLSLDAPIGCATTFQLVPSSRLDSGADGRTVTITSALYNETGSDDELAVLLAHELAHNALGHRATLQAEHVGKAPFGRDANRIRETEREADYVGVYFMARAGFDTAAAPAFWGRFGRAHGFGFLADHTHPGFAKRARAATLTIAEIAAKRARREALIPGTPPPE